MKNKEKGFTLIELLVVLVIIGILAALIVPKLSSVNFGCSKSIETTDNNKLKPAN